MYAYIYNFRTNFRYMNIYFQLIKLMKIYYPKHITNLYMIKITKQQKKSQ